MSVRHLSETDVLHIRILRGCHYSQREIAELYDVARTTVTGIVLGKIYREVAGPRQAPHGQFAVKVQGHGTPACYHRGCRLPECVAANNKRLKEYRERVKKRTGKPVRPESQAAVLTRLRDTVELLERRVASLEAALSAFLPSA